MMGTKWEGHAWSPTWAERACCWEDDVWVGPWGRRSPGRLRVAGKTAEDGRSRSVGKCRGYSPAGVIELVCSECNTYRVRKAIEEATKVGWDCIMKALCAWLRHTNLTALFVYEYYLPGWVMVSLWGAGIGLQSHIGIQSMLNEYLWIKLNK